MMRRDPDGTLWLTPEEWKIWVWIKHPEDCREASSETPAAPETRLSAAAGEQEALFEMEKPYAE